MIDLGSSDIAPEEAGDRPAGEAETVSFTFTPSLVAVTQPESIVAESIRSLRTVIMSQHMQSGRRSLAICAPSRGAGCSFLAANLAAAMAQIKVNTLLVDGNLRDPCVHEYIEPSEPLPGLADCLQDDAMPLGGIIRPIQPYLSVLYAGSPGLGGQDQIGGDTFRAIVSSCLRDYDLTIIDTPAANLYSDTRRIASVARYALVVARRQQTFLKDIRTLLDEFETDRTTVVGTYLNDY